jgi:hypothetical protein
VDPEGAASLYDHRHYVGAAYRGEVVRARLGESGREWVFEHGGQEVGRSPAAYLSAEAICGLRVGRRAGRSARRTAARRARREGAACPGG